MTKRKIKSRGKNTRARSSILKAIKLCVYIILLVAFTFFCAEFFMLVAEPWLFDETYSYDKDLGFRMLPSKNKNQFGFNDRDYPLEKKSGVYRIVIVSDSYNWAGGREGNYTALLEKMFEDHYGSHRVDVINAGYPGANPADALAVMKKFGMQYKPDLVVLGFFNGNDILDSFPEKRRIAFNGMVTDINRNKDYEQSFMGRAIIRRSRLLDLVTRRRKILAEKKKIAIETAPAVSGEEADKQPGYLSRDAKLEIEARRLLITNPDLHKNGSFQKRVYCVLDAVTGLNELSRKRGAEFAVAFYPDQFQVDPALLNAVIRKYNVDREKILLMLPQGILMQKLNELSVPYYDLTLRFREESVEKELYDEHDTHWNAQGNELAALLLFEWLVPKTNLELSK